MKFNASQYQYFLQPINKVNIDKEFKILSEKEDLTLAATALVQFKTQKDQEGQSEALSSQVETDLMLYKKYLKLIPHAKNHSFPTTAIDLENLYLIKGDQKNQILLKTDNFEVEVNLLSKQDSGVFGGSEGAKTDGRVSSWCRELWRWCIRSGLSKDYKLLDKIGKGGFGSVYKARDLKNQEIVAMKVIEKSRIKTVKNYRYLTDEIKYMRILDHPNLLKMHSVYDYRCYIVLVLEYVNGGTLAERIKAGQVDVNKALCYVHDILESLAYMHSMNIIHRDIKSTNIMFVVQEDPLTGRKGVETLKVIDFGLCGDLTDRSYNSLIHDKCGTLGYLAPELIAKKSKQHFYNSKVDVFSTGVLLYEMLNSRNPFKGSDYNDSLYRNYRAEIDYQTMRIYIPSNIIQFLQKLIARQPSNRVTALEALSDNVYFKEVFDEGSQILSNKLKFFSSSKTAPFLKGYKDTQTSAIVFSNKLHSSHLRGALFRYESSKNASGHSVGYTSASQMRNILNTQFGTYRGFSNGSIRNNPSLIMNTSLTKSRENSEKKKKNGAKRPPGRYAGSPQNKNRVSRKSRKPFSDRITIKRSDSSYSQGLGVRIGVMKHKFNFKALGQKGGGFGCSPSKRRPPKPRSRRRGRAATKENCQAQVNLVNRLNDRSGVKAMRAPENIWFSSAEEEGTSIAKYSRRYR